MRIVGICGSIKKDSTNLRLLNIVSYYFQNLEILLQKTTLINDELVRKWILDRAISNSGFHMKTMDISQLPFFDPDLQFAKTLPEKLQELRCQVQEADLLLISTPEYAHGIPGVLKNCLEWLICEETMKKPVAIVISSATDAKYIKEYLLETLRTMDLCPVAMDILVIQGNEKSKIKSTGEIIDTKLEADLINYFSKIF